MRARLPRYSFLLLALGGAVLAIVLIIYWIEFNPAQATQSTSPVRDGTLSPNNPQWIARSLDLPKTAPQSRSTPDTNSLVESPAWHDVVIKPGNTLSELFSNLGIYRDLPQLTTIEGAHEWLSRLFPGQSLRFELHDRQLKTLIIERSPLQQGHFVRAGDHFDFYETHREIDRRLAYAIGTIEHSLFQAGHDAGLSDQLVLQLAQIFRWDIDFNLDPRKGDQFALVYEVLLVDGEPFDEGNILAAEVHMRDTVFRALRYPIADEDAHYYTPDGRSLRRPFLRAPLTFTRISSKFSLTRKHPILGYTRAHRGVDYAAPTGTPIKAAGDGKVDFAGWKGGYGNTIVLAHANDYTTLYGHLSRFARGIRTGKRVRQGQTIGYVGSTGLSTGPHLHYEFRINGVHQNPLTVKLPGSPPLPLDQREAFRRATSQVLAQLETISRLQIADAKPD